MDGSEDLLIHCRKPNQTCAAGLDQLKGLYYKALQERQNPSCCHEALLNLKFHWMLLA